MRWLGLIAALGWLLYSIYRDTVTNGAISDPYVEPGDEKPEAPISAVEKERQPNGAFPSELEPLINGNGSDSIFLNLRNNLTSWQKK